MSSLDKLSEAWLSPDARAILRYARTRGGEPFTRQEIVSIAPGADWDPLARWPRTVADLDPIRELVLAGYVEVAGERPTKTGYRGRTYKLWKLTGVEQPRTLAELLDDFERLAIEGEWARRAGCSANDVHAAYDEVRAEIMRRYTPPREEGR